MKPRLFLALGLSLLAITLILAVCAEAQTETVLYTFNSNGSSGLHPLSAVVADSAGNLYGTTSGGGGGFGTVYKLSPTASGHWKQTTLYVFTDAANGATPIGSLVLDAVGNLYGTTSQGGSSTQCFPTGCGVVFKLSPNSTGTWAETVLHTFIETDGAFPSSALIFDQAGNLYGAASSGGNLNDCKRYGFGCGVIFKLSPNSDGTWTESILYAFTGLADGSAPGGPLLLHQSGNLYGTAGFGGIFAQPCPLWAIGCGVVFELSPTSSGPWTEAVLHTFNNTDGKYIEAGLVFDSTGNLYGAAGSGGAYDRGDVFEVSPNSDGTWTETTLYNFAGKNDGAIPGGQLVFDAAGNLYGATGGGGGQQCGTVFKLSPASSGWSETILHKFTCGTDGQGPNNLFIDRKGHLYGTTSSQNITMNAGVVFRITP